MKLISPALIIFSCSIPPIFEGILEGVVLIAGSDRVSWAGASATTTSRAGSSEVLETGKLKQHIPFDDRATRVLKALRFLSKNDVLEQGLWTLRRVSGCKEGKEGMKGDGPGTILE